MKLAQVVKDYVTVKRATGLRYRTAAAILKSFAGAAGPVNVRDVGQDTVLAFLNGSGPIRSSWHLKHYTLAGLFRFAIQRRLVSKSPLPPMIPKRPAYAKPYIYSADELRRMLDATSVLDERHPKGHKLATIPALTFRTLLLLLYGAGLRISEALALTVDDVDLSACTLLVRGTKFFKTRLLPIGPKLSSELGQCAIHRLGLVTRSFKAAPSSSTGVGWRSRARWPSATSGSSAAASASSVVTARTSSRACTISGTPLPCTGWSPGIARARTFSACCRSSRPTSATSAWPRPRSISP